MMRSIEWLRRRLSVASVLPLVILLGAAHNPTDPMRKAGGGPGTLSKRYAGVIPVPNSIVSSAPNRLDSLLDQHRDARAERGRVLYADGHEAKSSGTQKAHHRQCSDHVALARPNSTSPNS